jgi:mannose-6-phosphate isomerase-like protein (cupin superfamily)
MTDTTPRDDTAVVDLGEGAVIHLGLGARATPLHDFTWDPAGLQGYIERFAADGDEGRMVAQFHQAESWTSWERHPAGEEVVVLLSGRADLIQEIDGEERRVTLRPGQAVVNPTGVWHTADVHEPGDILTITPGRGTDHKPR